MEVPAWDEGVKRSLEDYAAWLEFRHAGNPEAADHKTAAAIRSALRHIDDRDKEVELVRMHAHANAMERDQSRKISAEKEAEILKLTREKGYLSGRLITETILKLRDADASLGYESASAKAEAIVASNLRCLHLASR